MSNNTQSDFFRKLYKRCSNPNAHLEIRYVNDPKRQIWIPLDKIEDDLPEFDNNRNCYFGVAARMDKQGDKSGIVEIPALWLDLDIEKGATQTKLNAFCLKPSIVVNSGGGLHVYWILKETARWSDIQKIENLLKRLAIQLDGDFAAAEAARILRVPGTYNYKYNPPRLVEIIESNTNVYDLDDFDALLDEAKDALKEKKYAKAFDGVPVGQRRPTLTSLAGRMIRLGNTRDEMLSAMLVANWQNPEPITNEQVEATLDGMLATHKRKHPEYKEPVSEEEIVEPEKVEPVPEEPETDPFIFPNRYITGIAGQFADLYSEYVESPKIFLFFSFLTAMGSVLANKITIDCELDIEPRLNTVLLGQSASERKSSSIKLSNDFFRDATIWIPGFPFLNVCYGVGSAEGLADELVEHNRLLLVYDEMASLFSKSKIQGSVLLPAVASLFENTHYQSRTAKKDVRIDNAHLSLLGASTIKTYETMWTSESIAVGFPNRLFVVPGKSTQAFPIPERIPEERKRAIANTFYENYETCRNGRVVMTIEPQASAMFDTWYRSLPKSEHAKRLETYAHRFMPLLAFNEGETVVNVGVMDAVIAIMNWELKIRTILDPIDADNKIAQMEANIKRHLGFKPLTERALRQRVNADKYGMWMFSTALTNLEKAEEIRKNTKLNRWEKAEKV